MASEVDGVSDPSIDELTNELAQLVLERAAPDELLLYDDMATEYFRDPSKALSQTRRDESLGFGLELVMLTPYVISVAQTVLKWLAQTAVESAMKEAAPAVSDYVKRLIRRGKKDHPEESEVIALTAPQLREVRSVAYEQATAAGLDSDKAGLIADSTVGALITAAP